MACWLKWKHQKDILKLSDLYKGKIIWKYLLLVTLIVNVSSIVLKTMCSKAETIKVNNRNYVCRKIRLYLVSKLSPHFPWGCSLTRAEHLLFDAVEESNISALFLTYLESDNLQYNTLCCLVDRLIDLASDGPSIILID